MMYFTGRGWHDICHMKASERNHARESCIFRLVWLAYSNFTQPSVLWNADANHTLRGNWQLNFFINQCPLHIYPNIGNGVPKKDDNHDLIRRIFTRIWFESCNAWTKVPPDGQWHDANRWKGLYRVMRLRKTFRTLPWHYQSSTTLCLLCWSSKFNHKKQQQWNKNTRSTEVACVLGESVCWIS